MNSKQQLLELIKNTIYFPEFNLKDFNGIKRLSGTGSQYFWNLWHNQIKKNINIYGNYISVKKNEKDGKNYWNVYLWLTPEEFDYYFKEYNNNRILEKKTKAKVISIIKCPYCNSDELSSSEFCSMCGYSLKSKEKIMVQLNEFGEELSVQLKNSIENVDLKESEQKLVTELNKTVVSDTDSICCFRGYKEYRLRQSFNMIIIGCMTGLLTYVIFKFLHLI